MIWLNAKRIGPLNYRALNVRVCDEGMGSCEPVTVWTIYRGSDGHPGRWVGQAFDVLPELGAPK